MPSKVLEEIQAVVDRLQQEGHTQVTRLENALKDLKAHFKKDKPEVEADVKKVADDVKADVTEAKAQVERDLAEPGDVPVKK